MRLYMKKALHGLGLATMHIFKICMVLFVLLSVATLQIQHHQRHMLRNVSLLAVCDARGGKTYFCLNHTTYRVAKSYREKTLSALQYYL
jgi:hypothetical protein